jgi:hypothetical protein
MAKDLTAILLPLPPRGIPGNDVVQLIAQTVQSAAWLRLTALEPLELHQLEVMEGTTGLPSVAPAMLVALSQNGGKALFLHVNHQAKQAILHAFEDGIEVASYTGEPNDDFNAELTRLVGPSIDELVAADDGTRTGFGQAASRTAAVVRGRLLLVPAGTPTGLGTFAFHDRGFERKSEIQLTDEDEAGDDDATTRAAFFAFDGGIISQAFGELPGKQLSQVVQNAPPEIVGPLIALRDQTARTLSQHDEAPGQAKNHPAWHTHAFEILALCHAGAYAGGDTVQYLNNKVFSVLSIGDATPIIDSDDAEELEGMPSILDAMVDVLPCPKPPGGYGPLFELIGPDEIGALVPWAQPGQPYDGAVFLIKPDRLLNLVRGFDGNRLGARLERFCRVLYTARYGKAALLPSSGAPPADADADKNAPAERPTEEYLRWRGGIEEKSRADLERFLTAWAELRVVLEVAAVNQLAVGVVVYE